ncbi:MAG: sulfotransferase family 2 domain-containing protein [Cyanobacteria bacterium J06600_6]
MILSHQHKFIFFCNPKTGSTSVETALEPYQEGHEFNHGLRQFYEGDLSQKLFPNKHLPPAILKAWLPETIWNDYYKFVFVRNPWDWFVSEWKYHFKPGKVSPSQLIRNPYALARQYKNYPKMKSLNSKKVFEVEDIDFLFNHLQRNFPVFPNAQGLFQSHYVCDVNGRQIVDYVAKFETIQDDFEKIKQNLKLDISLPHLNKTKHSSFQSYFTQKSRRRVAELWANDIERFEYSFD